MVESIIQGLVDYFIACPLLKNGAFRVDALGVKGIEYTIEGSIYDPVSVQYVDGSSERICQFIFGSREYYSLDRMNNIANSMFYEKFAAWVEDNDDKGVLPEMPEGCEARSIEVLSPGYLYSTDMKMARYQIQLRLTYVKEK